MQIIELAPQMGPTSSENGAGVGVRLALPVLGAKLCLSKVTLLASCPSHHPRLPAILPIKEAHMGRSKKNTVKSESVSSG